MQANAREDEDMEEVSSVVEDSFLNIPEGHWAHLLVRQEWSIPSFLPDLCEPIWGTSTPEEVQMAVD
jgi:hypothetical protein